MIRAALVKRQLTLWLLLRLTYASLIFLRYGLASATELLRTPQAAGALDAAAAGWAEVRRRRERVLLGNLGVSQLELVAIWIVPPVICESLIALFGGG